LNSSDAGRKVYLISSGFCNRDAFSIIYKDNKAANASVRERAHIAQAINMDGQDVQDESG
jgi:hypothetical protein